MYEVPNFENHIDDSGIYYEPAAYVPLPTYIYNHPFYIINPILQLREKNSTNPRPHTINIQHKHTQQVSDPYAFSAEIEIDINNARSSHNRKEKDIQADHNLSNRPLYLDIRVKAEDNERSASTNVFTAEDLKQTEKSLLECAEVYALLNYRKNNNIKDLNAGELSLLQKYDHLSSSNLKKIIDNKCLHISNIVQKSLNEIKENRPKKANSSLSIIREHQEDKDLLHDTDILNTRHNADTTQDAITEANLQQPVDFSRESESLSNYEDIIEYTDVTHTERESEKSQNEIKKYNTLPSQITSTTVPSISNEGMTTLTDSIAEITVEEILTNTDISTEKVPSFTSINMDNDYPLHTTNYLNTTSINGIELSTPPVTTKEEENIKGNRRFNNEVYNGNRNRYKEEDISLAKVITHEFSNDTVQSYINGTEDIPNDDFKNDNSEDDDELNMDETELIETNRSEMPIESDIHGNLYFLVNEHQIPARFIQKPNGTLQLGIDALTICDKFKQDGEFVSKLFSALCKCYESDNCTSLQN